MKVVRSNGVMERLRFFLTPGKTRRAIALQVECNQRTKAQDEERDAFEILVRAFPGDYSGLTLPQAIAKAAGKYGSPEFKAEDKARETPPFNELKSKP